MDYRSPTSSPVLPNEEVAMLSSPIWYKQRKYLHFDSPIGHKKAEKIVSNPKLVSTHAFFPLISVDIKTKKVSTDENGAIVPKEKKRPIKYASHIDSHIYSYYAHELNRLYENRLSVSPANKSVLAFRSLGKSNIDFALQAFNGIRAMGNCEVIALDISGFFDHLDHVILKRAWASLLGQNQLPADHFNVYKSLTKFSSVDRDTLFRTLGISVHNPRKDRKVKVCSISEFRNIVRPAKIIKKHPHTYGIPQGSAISSLLSNMYMLDFDETIHQQITKIGGKYYRYCDDMLFIVPTGNKESIRAYVDNEIKLLKLNINDDKTDVCTYYKAGSRLKIKEHKPLQYLGFTFNGKSIHIRSAAFAKYSERVKRGVRLAKMTMMKHNKERISNGVSVKPLYRKKLYARYSHLGKSNFVRYGLRSAKVMNSKAIRKQLRPLWGRLIERIER